jgi:hypothetical protein
MTGYFQKLRPLQIRADSFALEDGQGIGEGRLGFAS